MADIQWQPMSVPSRGVLYVDAEHKPLLPEGKVGLRKMTAQEESILLSQGAQGLERIAKIVTSCVRVPSPAANAPPLITPSDFLLTDRMALLLGLRTLTFRTPFYTYTYRCAFCNATRKATVNLAEDLEERTPETIADRLVAAGKLHAAHEFALQEPLEVALPDAGVTLQVRFLRGTDEDKIARRAKRLSMASNDLGDTSHIYRLCLQIVSVDGEPMAEGPKEAFVRALSSGDTTVWRLAVDEMEPGLDLTVYPTCTACGGDNEMPLPFTAEFFRPTTLHAG